MEAHIGVVRTALKVFHVNTANPSSRVLYDDLNEELLVIQNNNIQALPPSICADPRPGRTF